MTITAVSRTTGGGDRSHCGRPTAVARSTAGPGWKCARKPAVNAGVIDPIRLRGSKKPSWLAATRSVGQQLDVRALHEFEPHIHGVRPDVTTCTTTGSPSRRSGLMTRRSSARTWNHARYADQAPTVANRIATMRMTRCATRYRREPADARS